MKDRLRILHCAARQISKIDLNEVDKRTAKNDMTCNNKTSLFLSLRRGKNDDRR